MMDKWAFWRRKHRHDGTDSERIRYADLEGAPAGGSGMTAVSTDATLDGDGTSGDQLTVVSAPKLSTARTIELTGDVTGSASFDGSATASIAATVGNDSHTHGRSTLTSLVATGYTKVWDEVAWAARETKSYTTSKDSFIAGYFEAVSGRNYCEIRLGTTSGNPLTRSHIYRNGGLTFASFSLIVPAGVTVYFYDTDASYTCKISLAVLQLGS